MAKVNASASDVSFEMLEYVTPVNVINLQDMFITLNIYESMFENCLTADMLVNDSVNLPYKGPILGEEYLNFRLHSKAMEGAEGVEIWPPAMYTSSITDRHFTKDRQQLYMLHFVSELDLVNSHSTVSRSFRDKTIGEMVKIIFEEYVDRDKIYDLVVEETQGLETIIIPNWKPYQALNWLASRARSVKDVPNYLFWESTNQLNFKSIELLLEQEDKLKFIYSPVALDSKKMEQLGRGRMELDDLKILSNFNMPKNIDDGYYASKLITHDITKKTIWQHTYNLSDMYSKGITHTDKFMPISNRPTDHTVPDRQSFAPTGINDAEVAAENIQGYYDSKIFMHAKHDFMYAKSPKDRYDNEVERWKNIRNSLLHGLHQVKLQIQFPGMSYLRTGHCVDITVPSPERVVEEKPGAVSNPEDLIDKYLSGRYLITSLKHQIVSNNGRPKYTQVAEVVKDALHDVPAYAKGD